MPVPAVFARFLAALDVGIPLLALVELFGGLFPALPSPGVSGRSMFLDPYGSAVCGRVISGLLGRLTGPDMSALPFRAVADMGGDVIDDTTDAFDAIRLDSGRVELDKFEGPLDALPTFVLGLEGDICAIAEFGRSGSLPAAFAFRCSAIISRNAFRLAAPVALEVVVALLTDAWRVAFGLFESRSRAVFDLGSRLDMIAFALSGQPFAKVQYAARIASFTFGFASSRPFLMHFSASSRPPELSKCDL
jgi:hypothetical protein